MQNSVFFLLLLGMSGVAQAQTVERHFAGGADLREVQHAADRDDQEAASLRQRLDNLEQNMNGLNGH
jgi:hypothetical protein